MKRSRGWIQFAALLCIAAASVVGCGREGENGSGQNGDGYYQGPVRSNPDVGDEGKDKP